MERGTRPIDNPELLVAIVAAALSSGGSSAHLSIGTVVKSAVDAVIDADRAYLAYREELRKGATSSVSVVNNFTTRDPEAAARSTNRLET